MVSVSGFYAWLKRTPSHRQKEDKRLSDQIIRIIKASNQRFARCI